MSDPVQLELDAAIDPMTRFEEWLFRRLPDLSPRLFEDPECLTGDARLSRVRAVVNVRGLEYAIAGRRPDGKPETWGELLIRLQDVYGR